MQLIRNLNKGFKLLLKDKQEITFTYDFLKASLEWKRKPNKIRVDKNSELYNKSMKSFLQNDDIEMYSTDNEVKSITAERFIRTSKNKIHKHMASVSENAYIDKLDDIISEYNNTYHSTINMKPVDVESNNYIDSSEEINNNSNNNNNNNNNNKDHKYKIGDIVRTSKYKNWNFSRKKVVKNKLKRI